MSIITHSITLFHNKLNCTSILSRNQKINTRIRCQKQERMKKRAPTPGLAKIKESQLQRDSNFNYKLANGICLINSLFLV
jgi:hypothetical protein